MVVNKNTGTGIESGLIRNQGLLPRMLDERFAAFGSIRYLGHTMVSLPYDYRGKLD